MATPVKRQQAGPRSSPQVKRKFAFNLRKPIFTGPLLKQGAFHKAFKSRYFILYPGFLVYYESPERWQYDLQRGDTLGSRLGAIKLKGGSVQKAKNPPKGAKYAFTVICPDTSNKRGDVLFNCHSNEERYQWMTNIHSAIPSAEGKSLAETNHKEKEVADKGDSIPPPEATLRQDTVSEAALLASSKDNIDGEETHTDDILGPVTSPIATDSDTEGGDELVTSSVSIKVEGNGSPTAQEEPDDDTVPLPEYANNDTVPLPEYANDTVPAREEQTVNEVKLAPEEKAQFLISVVDHSLLADSDVDLSEDDPTSPVHITSPTTSNTSSPPPDVITTSPSPPPPHSTSSISSTTSAPVITVTQGTITKDTRAAVKTEGGEGGADQGSDSGNSSPELSSAFNRDTRRPSGAMSLVDKRGYLYKMGGKVKSWNLRYFVLQPGVFRYYKNDPNGKQLGEVKLKNVKVMLPKQGEKVFSSFQFTVHTESSWNKRRDWSIAAANEKDMKEWMEAFQVAGGGQPIDSNGSE